jgi:hypothetical protein
VQASRDHLPRLYRTGTTFTTYFIRSTGLANHPEIYAGTHNLGLLIGRRYLNEPKIVYCSGQSRSDSASLTYDGPDNKWKSEKEWLASPSQLRSAYPARLIEVPQEATQIGGTPMMQPMPPATLTDWRYGRFRETVIGPSPRTIISRDLSQKVIYSDFTGVSQWQGGGIELGFVSAPHKGQGYSRLFGDGAVRWMRPELINQTPVGLPPLPRPVSSSTPTPQEQADYYKVLDRF